MLEWLLQNELFWVLILAAYVLLFTFVIAKKFYYWMIKRYIKEKVAIYYNRKIIHIFAGGIVVLAVPFVFDNPWYPLLAGVLAGLVTFFFHRSGRLLYWFQKKSDFNEVTFCFMWGLAIFILWNVLGDKWIAIIPPAFIAFGDGITGIIRNLAFHERRKHPIGNIYMAGFSIPIGYFFGSMSSIDGIALWAVIAAIVASIFERYEFGPIDDNILITLSATLILYVGGIVGPII